MIMFIGIIMTASIMMISIIIISSSSSSSNRFLMTATLVNSTTRHAYTQRAPNRGPLNSPRMRLIRLPRLWILPKLLHE